LALQRSATRTATEDGIPDDGQTGRQISDGEAANDGRAGAPEGGGSAHLPADGGAVREEAVEKLVARFPGLDPALAEFVLQARRKLEDKEQRSGIPLWQDHASACRGFSWDRWNASVALTRNAGCLSMVGPAFHASVYGSHRTAGGMTRNAGYLPMGLAGLRVG
jgi:hypothetical protein